MSLTLTRRYNVDRFGYLIPTRYGNVPMVGAVATYRPGEGRFGGAVAVEEGTVNLVPSPHERYKPVGINRLNLISPSQGLEVGTYTISFEYKFDSDPELSPPAYFLLYGISSYTTLTRIPAGAWEGKTQQTFEVTSDLANLGVSIYGSVSSNDSIPRGVTFYNLQIEQKPFATSFVDGTRANGDLRYYDESAGGNDYTIALWAKTHTNDPSTWQPLFDGRHARSQSMLAFNTSDVLMILYKNSSGVYDFRSTGFSMGDRTGWHHYVLTFTGPRSSGTFRVFVDGQLVYTHKDSLQLPGTFGMYIGRGTPTNELWNGLIDELLILPYAASEEEIASWYEAQGLLPPHPQASLQWDRQAVRPAQMVKL
jgi:hypothetical protein